MGCGCRNFPYPDDGVRQRLFFRHVLCAVAGRVRGLSRRRFRRLLSRNSGPVQRWASEWDYRRPAGSQNAGRWRHGAGWLWPDSGQHCPSSVASSGRLCHRHRRGRRAGLRACGGHSSEMVQPSARACFRHRRFRHRRRHPGRAAIRGVDDNRTGLAACVASRRRHRGRHRRSIWLAGDQPPPKPLVWAYGGGAARRHSTCLCDSVASFPVAASRISTGFFRAVHAHRALGASCRRPGHIPPNGSVAFEPAGHRQRRWTLRNRNCGGPHWPLAGAGPVFRRRWRELHPVAHVRRR